MGLYSGTLEDCQWTQDEGWILRAHGFDRSFTAFYIGNRHSGLSWCI